MNFPALLGDDVCGAAGTAANLRCDGTWYTLALVSTPSKPVAARAPRLTPTAAPGPRSASPPPRPTIRAVAERADVAISTVSRVINGGRVSDAVRRRVSKAIQELDYTPSIAAQSLVGRRTGCIGLVVNSTQSPWFTQILLGVEEALAPSRKSVVIGSLMLSGEYDSSTVSAWIQERRVDGLVVVRHSLRDQALLDAAHQAQLPVVLIAPDLTAPCSFAVRSNNLQAGRLAAHHLAELGHRRLAFAGGPRESIDTRMRLAGAQEALTEFGAQLPEDHIWYGRDYAPQAGIAFARRFTQLPAEQRPTGVILGNDSIAIGFMRELLVSGYQLPQQVSVVGFDGTPDGERFWPALTTVRQRTREMAAHACRALLQTLASPDTPIATATEYPVELVVRESTLQLSD